MFTTLKWVFRAVVVLSLAAVLHYTLPQRDIVRITGTDIQRADFSGISRWFYARADMGAADSNTRDLRLINTVDASGKIRVYRNEDTGFGWPFYFKLDSQDLQAEAQDEISTREEPRWVAIKNYGWRLQFLSAYPNATSLKLIDNPDVRLIPWTAIVILVILFALFWAIYVRWRRFIDRRVEPMIENADAAMDEQVDRVRGWFSRD